MWRRCLLAKWRTDLLREHFERRRTRKGDDDTRPKFVLFVRVEFYRIMRLKGH